MRPSTPRGWLCWALYVSARYAQPHGVKYEYDGRQDWRTNDQREEAISVSLMAERASHEVCGNGIGYALLTAYYADDAPWFSFSRPEQRIIARTARDFYRRLREAGFLS
ncbi:MAG: hypothetical protein AB1346_10300 [Thermodesulfobacteriota bacterium]